MQRVAHGMIEILTPVRTFLRSGLTVWEQESPHFREGRQSTPLLKEGLLELAYPKTLQHPNQAYRTTEKGLAYLETLDNDPQQNLLI